MESQVHRLFTGGLGRSDDLGLARRQRHWHLSLRCLRIQWQRKPENPVAADVQRRNASPRTCDGSSTLVLEKRWSAVVRPWDSSLPDTAILQHMQRRGMFGVSNTACT
eukprot:5993864-Pleurochrysis_carterae.AAC.3